MCNSIALRQNTRTMSIGNLLIKAGNVFCLKQLKKHRLPNRPIFQKMASANIPLNKVNNVHFRSFLEKYTAHPIADDSTLRKNDLPLCYENKLQKFRSMVGENKIDETPDACRRSIANVVIADRPSDIFLLDSQVLDAVNNFTIAILFDNAMKLL